jgi:hypothetical protein
MSPTIFREKSYRLRFFSMEEDRMHIHIVSGNGKAKFWIEPEISLAMSQNIPTHELSMIEKIVKEHQDEIKRAWKEHFNG